MICRWNTTAESKNESKCLKVEPFQRQVCVYLYIVSHPILHVYFVSVPDESYFRKTSRALNWICTIQKKPTCTTRICNKVRINTWNKRIHSSTVKQWVIIIQPESLVLLHNVASVLIMPVLWRFLVWSDRCSSQRPTKLEASTLNISSPMLFPPRIRPYNSQEEIQYTCLLMLTIMLTFCFSPP